jgi:hypothetical protein
LKKVRSKLYSLIFIYLIYMNNKKPEHDQTQGARDHGEGVRAAPAVVDVVARRAALAAGYPSLEDGHQPWGRPFTDEGGAAGGGPETDIEDVVTPEPVRPKNRPTATEAAKAAAKAAKAAAKAAAKSVSGFFTRKPKEDEPVEGIFGGRRRRVRKTRRRKTKRKKTKTKTKRKLRVRRKQRSTRRKRL